MRQSLRLKWPLFLATLLVAGSAVSAHAAADLQNPAQVRPGIAPREKAVAEFFAADKYVDGVAGLQAALEMKRSQAPTVVAIAPPAGTVDASRLNPTESIERIDYTYVTGTAAGGAGGLITDNALRPALSGNGNFVVFTSAASNLVATDNNGVMQVYRADISGSTPTYTLISKNPGTGLAGDFASGMATFAYTFEGALAEDVYLNSISDDGSAVVFTSEASNLTSVANPTTNVFLWRAGSPETVTLVSTDATGAVFPGSSKDGLIQGDGNGMVFLSTGTLTGTTARAVNTTQTSATNPLTGRTLSLDLFYKALPAGTPATGAVTLVTHDAASTTTEANSDTLRASISADGSKVAYESRATNLGLTVNPVAPNGTVQARGSVWLWDRTGNTSTLLSVNASGAAPALGTNTLDDCFLPSISPNGQYVSWITTRVLGTGGAFPTAFGTGHVVVRDTTGPATALQVVNTIDGTARLSPGFTRIATPTALNSGAVVFWCAGDITLPTPRSETNFRVYIKRFTNFATGSAGTISLLSKNGTTAPNTEIAVITDGFAHGPRTRPSVNTAGTRVVFDHNSEVLAPTAGLINVFAADFDSADTVSNLRKVSVGSTVAGASVAFSGRVFSPLSTGERPAISDNGRYMVFPLHGFGPFEVTGNVVYQGAIGHHLMRVDLVSRELRVASLDPTAAAFTPNILGDIGLAFGHTLSTTNGTLPSTIPFWSFSESTFPSNRWSAFFNGYDVANDGKVAYRYSLTTTSTTPPVGWRTAQIIIADPTTGTATRVLGFDNNVFNDRATNFSNIGGLGFYTEKVMFSSDGRYVGFSSSSTNVHPDQANATAPALNAGCYYGFIYNVTNPAAVTGQRLVSRKVNIATGTAQDTPEQSGLGGTLGSRIFDMTNDGRRALVYADAQADWFIPTGDSTAQMFLYSDTADGSGTGVAPGATMKAVSTNSAGGLWPIIDADLSDTGWASRTVLAPDASAWYTIGLLDDTSLTAPNALIVNVPAGQTQMIPGIQLYKKDIGGYAAGTANALGNVTALSAKTTAGTFWDNTLNFTPASTGDEFGSHLSLSSDGTILAVSTTNVGTSTNTLPGAGVDQNSPTSADTLSDVYAYEPALGSTPWTIVSRAAGALTQDSLGGAQFGAVNRATISGQDRATFVFGANWTSDVAPHFNTKPSLYVKKFTPTPPASTSSSWTTLE